MPSAFWRRFQHCPQHDGHTATLSSDTADTSQIELLEDRVTETFEELVAVDSFPETGLYAATINGWHILVSQVGGVFSALNDRCTHAASPLSLGRVRGEQIICPKHGARFELKTGKCVGGAHRDIRTFPVKIEDGIIWVQVPDRQPSMDELPVP
jgi:anthranilate 1,2-dioxygenase ferredoxin component